MSFVKSKIISSGIHLPEQIVKSDHLFESINSETRYGIPTNWMSKDMGIIERRMADESVYPSDLAIPAAQEAIEKSGVNPDLIDMVIFCGIERDRPKLENAHSIRFRN